LGLPMYDAPNAVEVLKKPREHPTPELYAVGRTNLYFEFKVDYEAAKAFRKANGGYLRNFQ